VVPDEAAAKMSTVGDMVTFVSQRTAARPSFCASQRVFYALRRQLPRETRPATRLSEVRNGVHSWRAICRHAGFPRPWFAPRPETMERLVRQLVQHHRARLTAAQPCGETEVRTTVLALTRAQFGVSAAEVTETTRLVDLAPDG
jgi:hypothetical protein